MAVMHQDLPELIDITIASWSWWVLSVAKFRNMASNWNLFHHVLTFAISWAVVGDEIIRAWELRLLGFKKTIKHAFFRAHSIQRWDDLRTTPYLLRFCRFPWCAEDKRWSHTKFKTMQFPREKKQGHSVLESFTCWTYFSLFFVHKLYYWYAWCKQKFWGTPWDSTSWRWTRS